LLTTGEQMSIPAKVMGIADIFEALTAKDRPYKKPMPLSQALTILERMKEDKHIDPDLFHNARSPFWLKGIGVFLPRSYLN
jgi:HD-GYP domain-containing protein (c-di-GMP phosphodiesterase class II)